MRCEICNRSMTETYLDGHGDEHEYCGYCADEIKGTLESYDAEDEDWFLHDPYDYSDAEEYEDPEGAEVPTELDIRQDD